VVAKIAGKPLSTFHVSAEQKNEASYKAINPSGKFPLLETPEGTLLESHAIVKFLAHGHASLLGTNAVERALIDQWMNWMASGAQQVNFPAMLSILGHSLEVTQAAFNDSVKGIKENLRAIDQGLNGDWLAGSKCSVADIVLAAQYSLCFQLVLDQGFTKAAPKACAWFARVSSLPEFVSVFGKIKMAKKSLKPVLKTEEKPKKVAAAAAAKPKDAGDEPPKKEINPLDALPPTNFDLFNFKTFFVNHPDRMGEGFEELMKQVDLDGYTWWWLHYEKVGKEGTIEYQFSNLLEGFVQRLDGFRKHAFGKICMLGAEPSLEIMGVLLIRGKILPQECIDHPQFEYMRPRTMDMTNEADKQLVREFMASKDGTGTANGLPIKVSMWHK